MRLAGGCFTRVACIACFLPCLARAGSDSAQVDRKIVMLPEHVVREQWPVLRNFVHVPAEFKQLEAGQCVRFAVTASGIGSDKLLRDAKLSFEFSFSSKTQTFAPEPVQAFKETTLITHDALMKSFESVEAAKSLLLARYMAVSGAGWCAPADVQDGTASVKGTVLMAGGKTVTLERRSIELMTFATARRHHPFKGLDALGEWTVHYHSAPDPAQLLPAIRMVARDQKLRDSTNTMAFFVAALKTDKTAAEELMGKFRDEERWVQLYCAAVLDWAGYPTQSLTSGFSEQDKSLLQSVHLPDAYDMTPGSDIGARQDMLWGMFFATGRIEPVRAVASELAWGDDYIKYKKAVDAGEHLEWSDSLGRAAGYAAAGWSIGSLAQQDLLVDDYVEALKAAPDTAVAVKKELENLYKNPAFRGPGSN